MIAHKGHFFKGFGLLVVFVVILVLMFTPLFKGHNALEYLDDLYNSISKGSAYYIPKVRDEAAGFNGSDVSVTLIAADKNQAEQTEKIFQASGAKTSLSGENLNVEGDLGKIFENCIQDADDMYYNRGEKISGKYGFNEKQVIYNWWTAFKSMEKNLKKQGKFKEANITALVVKKAIECSYNYYGIEPQKISDRIGIVIFSLIFYVVYTLWYGFAIMFMFEGWGMQLEH